MAVLAFAAAGALIAPAGYAAIGWSIGALVGQALFPTKLPDQNVEGPRLSDLRVQTSAYGQMVPIVGGTVRIAGNLIWAKPVREVTKTQSQNVGGGGKGGGGGQSVNQTTYSYFADFAVLLCEGPVAAIRKIWINGELKYNVAADASAETIFASALTATSVRLYVGDELQEQDSLIAADVGINDCPAYRGYAYLVVEGMDVTQYSGRPPQMEFEIVVDGTTSPTLEVTSGAAVSTTSVVAMSPTPVLGRGGNVWAQGAVSNTAVRLGFYSNGVRNTYTRPTWGYIPFGIGPTGEAVYGNYGGFFGFLRDDGSVTEYSSAPGIMGSNGVAFDSATTGFAQGDSSSGANFYRFGLDQNTMTVSETLLSAARSVRLFSNACGIAGRCYVYGASTFGHEVGYVTSGNAKVLLFSGTQYAAAGLLVSSDGYLWMARESTGTDVEKRTADGVLVFSVTIPSGSVARIFEGADGYIWAWVSAGAIYGIHPATGEIAYTSENTGTATPLGFTDDNRLVLISSSGGTVYFHEMERLPRVTAGSVDRADFVAGLLERVGINASDVELADLAGELRGYSIARRDSVRNGVQPLLLAAGVDLIESDDKIRAVARGGSPVVVIPEGDLAARAYGTDAPSPVPNVRRLETELPREVSVRYIDADADYAIGTQYARRLTGQSQNVQTFDVPVVLTAQEAAAIAERVLYEAWVSRTAQDLVLSRKYAWLDPADVIQVEAATATYTLRIADANYSGGVLKIHTETQDLDVYTSAAVGAGLPAPSADVGPAGPTELRLLDIPLLRDADDGPGFYAAAAGYYSGWRGAELWYSVDAGATYTRSQTAFLAASVMGAALSVLPNFLGGNIVDELSRLDVQVFGGALSSVTDEQFLAGGLALLVGGEILLCRDATLTAPGKYRLSTFLRARGGTDQYLATHAIGEAVVLLSLDALKRVGSTAGEIGIARTYKAPGFGQALVDASAIEFTDSGVSLKPLAPVHLAGGRNAAGDVLGTFVRRTRIGGEWRDYVDAQLGEASEAYEVDIYTNSTYSTIKRTLAGLSSPAFTYTSAQQVTDFGSNQATVYVRVYQISAVVGRGFACQGAI